jgi:hypothetical protein
MGACLENIACTGFFYGRHDVNGDGYWLMKDMTNKVVSDYHTDFKYDGFDSLTCVDKWVPPTGAPTAMPSSRAPTKYPTKAPTLAPTTGVPTDAPTAEPTKSPTDAPTSIPTSTPTVECDQRSTPITVPEIREQFRKTVDTNSASGFDWEHGDLDIVELKEAVRALGECELYGVVSESKAVSHVTLREFCDQIIDEDTCTAYHANNLHDGMKGILCDGMSQLHGRPVYNNDPVCEERAQLLAAVVIPTALPTISPTDKLVVPEPEELPEDLKDGEVAILDDDWSEQVALPPHSLQEDNWLKKLYQAELLEHGGWRDENPILHEEALYKIQCSKPVTFELQLHFEFSVPAHAGLAPNKDTYRSAIANVLGVTETRIQMEVRSDVNERRRLFFAEIVKVVVEAESRQDLTTIKARLLQGHFSIHMAYQLTMHSKIHVVADHFQVFESTFMTAVNPLCNVYAVVPKTKPPTNAPTAEPTFPSGGPPPGAAVATHIGPPAGAHFAAQDKVPAAPPAGAHAAGTDDDLVGPPVGSVFAGMDDDRVWDPEAHTEESYTWHGESAVGSAVDVLHSAHSAQEKATAQAAAEAAAAAAARDDDDLFSHVVPTESPTVAPTVDSILSLLKSTNKGIHAKQGLRKAVTGVADMFTNHAIHKAVHNWTPMKMMDGEAANKAVDSQSVHDLTDAQLVAVAHPADVQTYTHGWTNCDGATLSDIPTEPLTCTKISGNINIVNSPIKNLNFLSNVQQIDGAIVIQNCPNLTSLAGLSQLVSVGHDENKNSILVQGAGKLVSLNGLESLLFVSGSVQILQNPKLIHTDSLDTLVSVGADNNGVSLQFVENLALQRINMPSLHGALDGALHIARNPKLEDIRSLKQLTSLGKDTSGVSLLITHNDVLPNVIGLQGIHKYAGSVEIANNMKLSKLNSILSNIESVGKNSDGVSFQIRNNEGLRSLSLVHKVAVPGSLTVAGNPVLGRVSFSGLISLGEDTLGNSLAFINNNKLSKYADHHPSTTGAVTVDMNPKLHTLMGGATCEVSLFSKWSQCSRLCGGGFHVRRRRVINAGPKCPKLEELVACNTQPCNSCSTGDAVDVVWHSNRDMHNHITHTFNILSDHRGEFRGRPNWGQTKLGLGKEGAVQGHFDLGKTGPWKVQFAVVSSERHYPSSLDDYVDINVGGVVVSRKYNQVKEKAQEIVSFYTSKPYVNYSLTWHSTVEDPSAHMEVLSGVAACAETSAPTQAPTPAPICVHTHCDRVPGEVAYTVTHDSDEEKKIHRCGFEGTATPERTGSCVCRCSDEKYGTYATERLARVRQRDQFPKNAHPNLRGANGDPLKGSPELHNFIPMRIHELSGMHQVAAP